MYIITSSKRFISMKHRCPRMDGKNIYTNRTFELFSGLGYQILRMPNNSVTKRMGYLVQGSI